MAAIIVTAMLGASDFAWVDGLRREHYPSGRNLVPAHLTLFGHLPPSIAGELKRRLAAETRGVRAPRARIAGLIDLDGGVAFRAESPGLEDMRDRLADAFAPLLMPQDKAGWRPHITIQNKVAPNEARALLRRLSVGFRPRALEIAGLASWHYLGGPWEPLSEHRFRS